jgi:hypothetical protein
MPAIALAIMKSFAIRVSHHVGYRLGDTHACQSHKLMVSLMRITWS